MTTNNRIGDGATKRDNRAIIAAASRDPAASDSDSTL